MASEPVIKLYVIVAGEPRFQGSARVFDDEPNAGVEANIPRALGKAPGSFLLYKLGDPEMASVAITNRLPSRGREFVARDVGE